MRALVPGVEIGPFRILRLLGEGGVGRVYAALDTDLGRNVALKALRPELSHDAGFVERFRAEAANLARLQHSNITTLFSLHRDGRDLYMVMELVRGYTLEEVLARLGRLTTDAVRAIAAQACAGLGYAHRMSIIHRDIKTANLMLTESGQLKIMDFGIARVRGSQRMTRAGNIIGTLEYMPPEQIKGADNDERSDIYSLAIALYELLCGNTPFRRDNEFDLMQAHRDAPPPALTGRCLDLDPTVEAALQRALAKAPDARFQTTADFAVALGANGLPREPAELARDLLLAKMPPLPELIEAAPAPAAKGDAFATRVRANPVPPNAAPPKPSTRRIPLPVLILGCVALFAVVGLVSAYALLGPAAGPSRTQSTPSPEQPPSEPAASLTPHDDSSPGVPLNPQFPTLPGTAPVETATAKPDAGPPPDRVQTCPPADRALDGHVDSVSESGWPEINGCEIHLYGVANLDTTSQQRLAVWLAGKGNQVSCRPMPNGERQCETATTPPRDLSRYLLRNGLAEAAEDVPRSYLDEQDKAKLDHLGRWR